MHPKRRAAGQRAGPSGPASAIATLIRLANCASTLSSEGPPAYGRAGGFLRAARAGAVMQQSTIMNDDHL